MIVADQLREEEDCGRRKRIGGVKMHMCVNMGVCMEMEKS
jgi:hypothetical protein